MKTVMVAFLLAVFSLIQPLAARVVRVEVKARKEVADLPDAART